VILNGFKWSNGSNLEGLLCSFEHVAVDLSRASRLQADIDVMFVLEVLLYSHQTSHI
jgi:hypothetical protein